MFALPDWTFEFHGHCCLFMPIGYRMGTVMLKTLEVRRALDHDYSCLRNLKRIRL